MKKQVAQGGAPLHNLRAVKTPSGREKKSRRGLYPKLLWVSHEQTLALRKIMALRKNDYSIRRGLTLNTVAWQ